MSAVAQAALLVSFPVAAGAIGSTVAAVRRPGPRLVSGTQHFAAGVVVAALAGELLPDLRHEGNLGWATAGFTAGVALVLSLAATDVASTTSKDPHPYPPQAFASQPPSPSGFWRPWRSTWSSTACLSDSARNWDPPRHSS